MPNNFHLWNDFEVNIHRKILNYGYLDDILQIPDDQDSVLTKLDKYFLLKPDSVSEPHVYLGAQLKLMQLEDGVLAWDCSLSKYTQESIYNCKKYVEENLHEFYKLTQLATKLFPKYRPVLDVLPTLLPEQASFYQSLMDIVRWMIVLCRIEYQQKHLWCHLIWWRTLRSSSTYNIIFIVSQ